MDSVVELARYNCTNSKLVFADSHSRSQHQVSITCISNVFPCFLGLLPLHVHSSTYLSKFVVFYNPQLASSLFKDCLTVKGDVPLFNGISWDGWTS